METLLRALEDEARMYGELLTLLAKKRDALVALKTAEVEGLVAQEEALLSRLTQADAARRRAAAEAAFAARLGAGASLTQIAAAVPEPKLRVLRVQLQKLAVEVARANDLNRALAEQSLAHVRETLLVLTGVDADATAYTRRGAEVPPPSAGRMNIVDSVA